MRTSGVRGDHDELIEQAAAEIAALVERLEDRGSCPECLAVLLVIAAQGCDAITCQMEASQVH